jgi:iron complex transport system ATP-binding protein
VIAAMHDLNLAARYFPRLLLFQRGIVADGGPAEVLESGLLSRVYGVNVQVGILRGAEHLSVLPPSSKNPDREHDPQKLPKVHVMAGGGSGEVIMRALADAAIPFTAGALNIGDSDHTLALRLASHVITEQPYAPISVQTAAQVRESLNQASVLILCPTPIGPGNLALLQEALHAAQHGLPVIVLATPPTPQNISPATFITQSETMQHVDLASRDYTGGTGLQLLDQLIAAGATIVNAVGEVIELTKKYIATTNR